MAQIPIYYRTKAFQNISYGHLYDFFSSFFYKLAAVVSRHEKLLLDIQLIQSWIGQIKEIS